MARFGEAITITTPRLPGSTSLAGLPDERVAAHRDATFENLPAGEQLAQRFLVVDPLEVGAIARAVRDGENDQPAGRQESANALEKVNIRAGAMLRRCHMALPRTRQGPTCSIVEIKNAAANESDGASQSSSNEAWLSRLGCE